MKVLELRNMKRINIYLTFMIVLLSSCAKLNMHEIRSMDKLPFQNLELIPGQEHNELRIDVIRQITETYYDGTTTYYEDVPYHPLGFDLGNGLFYDLNGNLSFRLDHLLNFDPNEPFEVNENIKPKNDANNFIHTYINEALVMTRLPQRNSKVLYHKQSLGDSTIFMKKARFQYAMSISDSSLSYAYKNHKPLKIHTIDKNNYYSFRRKKLREFRNLNNTLLLGRTFTMHLSDDKNTITVNTPWRERNNAKPRITIQKDRIHIYIYSKGFKGRKIEFTDFGVLVTGTNLKPVLYKKVDASGNLPVQSAGYE